MAQEVEHGSLKLAFLGDAVYELAVRKQALSEVSGHVDKLNRHTKQLSMAVTQARIADLLVADGILSDEELAVFKRGRNAKTASFPKSCSPAEYRKATGLEALMGHLYLEGKAERAEALIRYGAGKINEIQE